MILIKVEDRDQFGQGNRSRGIAIAQILSREKIDYCIISSTRKWFDYLKLNLFETILIEKDYNSNLEVEAISNSFESFKIDFIVLDGDRFDMNYIDLLISHQIKSVILDDVAKIKRTNAWRLINPNIYATGDLYSGWGVKSYLGGDYVLLRDAFQKAPQFLPIKNKILLALGVMMDPISTLQLSNRLEAAGFKIKIAIGLSPEEMVDEIDSSALIVCGVSVTLHEVWNRKRIALPIYQAKDQILFHEFLKSKNIPQIISIGRTKSDVVEDIVSFVIKNASKMNPQICLNEPRIDILFKELVNDAQ
ncbi:hypothetical protein [Aquirufa aurantiipilula]|uniref:Uncharacterized protein n=1 Tax=Aquirufa aurantiipilula TaxID=2696561 RepID=A0ABT6BKE3_9BACT|nr:hypothetical protein [Aquirufa aurantiipilula]MDF5690829.1 hypothetical protein [Aquirufa aurantiipilula]